MVLLITMLQKSPPEKELLQKKRKAPPSKPRNTIRVSCPCPQQQAINM
jgi:hypothetical protein